MNYICKVRTEHGGEKVIVCSFDAHVGDVIKSGTVIECVKAVTDNELADMIAKTVVKNKTTKAWGSKK